MYIRLITYNGRTILGDADWSDLLSPLTYRPAKIRLGEIAIMFDHNFLEMTWIAGLSDISEKSTSNRENYSDPGKDRITRNAMKQMSETNIRPKLRLSEV